MSYSIDVSDLFKYAESSGVAIHPFETDVTSLLSLIAELCAPDGGRSEVNTKYEDQLLESIGDFNHTKLRLNHESARLLSAAHNALKAETPSLNWDALLPQAHDLSASSSYYGAPLLTEQEERRLQPSLPRKQIEMDVLQYAQTHCSLYPSPDINPPASITETSELCRNNLGTKKLKLSISNESLRLISRARRVGAFPRRAAGFLFAELLKVPKENIAHPAKLVISTEHCEAQSTPGRGCIPSPFIPERERASSIHHYLSEEKETTAVFTESQITTSLAKFISPETQETGKEKLFTNVESKVSDYKSSKTNSNHLLVDELKREPNLRSFDGNPVQDLECMAQAVLDTNGVRQPVDDPAAWPIQTPEIPTSSREFVLANDMPKGLNNKIQRQSSIAAEHVSSTLPNIGSFNVGFGSLSTFMETRGLPDSKHRSKISHSSSNSTRDNEDKEESTLKRPDDFKFVHDANIYSPPIDQSSFINVPSIIEPHFEFNASNLIIFISTDLLKSHIRLVQSLEQRKDSPKCFYRDYSQSQSPQDLNALIPLPQTPINTPQEADLIIAPSVGVILTTSQALSQLYLPGHKSTDPAIRSNLSITSPLKERIFRLTQRYDILYVLISHSSSNAASERGRTQLLFQMNKSTQESFDAIQQFCSSISSTMKIFPLLIPAFPETIAEWILALAARHASHILTADYLQNTTLPSIAVRGEEYREWSVNQLIKEDETQWEIWLRSFGLNPYAARAVLDILEAEGDYFTKNSRGERSGPQKETDEISKSAFMRFIQMGPLERLERFKVLLGEHLLFIFQQAIKLGS